MTKINPQNQYLKELYKLLIDLPDEQIVKEIIKDFLTASEIESLAKRWQIVKMLNKGISQREISEKLGVGVATITHGSRQLKKNGNGFRWLLDKSEKRELRTKKK